MPAFDTQRPPQQELINDCVHCGFCLDSCPTYVLWAQEADSPRGRIVLMDEGLNDASELTPEMATHFDRCLGCMACVTACPSGVQYDRLIEQTRSFQTCLGTFGADTRSWQLVAYIWTQPRR